MDGAADPASDGADSGPARRGRAEADASPRRIIDARGRFGRGLAGLPRPWEAGRRRVLIVCGVIVAVLALAVAALFLPPLRAQQVAVTGTSYVDSAAVSAAASPELDEPLAFVDAQSIQRAAEEVDGVASATVHRQWPDTISVAVVEREPFAVVSDAAGSRVVDSIGVVLPISVDEEGELPAVSVAGTSQDVPGTTSELLDALSALPPDLLGRVTDMTASTHDDISFTLTGEDGGTKHVIWGSAEDSGIKAEVVGALMTKDGGTIDVSSPRAPVMY